MAQDPNSTSSNSVQRFDKELNEDMNDFHLPKDSWTQARNAINNSITGDIGRLGNEPANVYCTKAPYPIIGAIHLESDQWVIFSTNDTDSEIGRFSETSCTYTKLVNDPCLGFKRTNLIKGVSRPTSDCTFMIYWDDSLNVSRAMDVDNIPWIQVCTDGNGVILPGPTGYVAVGCITCTDTDRLDCDKIRLARLVNTPCFSIQKSANGGTLPNGSYFAVIAYTINSQKIGDYSLPSNVQPMYDHNNVAGSLEVIIDSIDTRYDEFQLVIVSIVNQQTVARIIGIYDTHQKRITIDSIDPTWPVETLATISIRTPVFERTDAMYTVNDYLLRVGPRTRFDFNYQPLANQIAAKWQSIEYPTNYYRNGGSNVAYMRDEVYSFFIRWVYNTGDKTPSYHIPGRPLMPLEYLPGTGLIVPPLTNTTTIGTDALPDEITAGINYVWAVNNLAQALPPVSTPLPDGGVVIGEGYMGYWESSEYYPDTKPHIYNANDLTNPWATPTTIPYPGTNPGFINTTTGSVTLGDYDLCGKPIRHHRFPEESTHPSVQTFTDASPNFGNAIRLMGVKFENIRPPVDNAGNLIPGIEGYEILRGSRNGNRTVLAKGIICNIGTYALENGAGTGGLVNYPYNDLRRDEFLSDVKITNNGGISPLFGGIAGESPAFISPTVDHSLLKPGNWSNYLFSFHGPETSFYDPFLSAKEIKIYGEINGNVTGQFIRSEKHPKEKLLTDTAFFLAAMAGIGIAGLKMNGKRTSSFDPPHWPGFSFDQPGTTDWTSVPYTGPLLSTVSLWTEATPSTLDSTFFLTTDAGFNSAGNAIYEAYWKNGGNLLGSISGINTDDSGGSYGLGESVGWSNANTSTGNTEYMKKYNQDDGDSQNMPQFIRFLSGMSIFFNYFTNATDSVIQLIKAMQGERDFALRYQSHCFYNRYLPPAIGARRRAPISDSIYMGPQITNFDGIKINNLYRSKTVVLKLGLTLPNPQVFDVTKIRASDVEILLDVEHSTWGSTKYLLNPDKTTFTSESFLGAISPPAGGNAGSFYAGHTGIQIASSHYVALKQRIRNQYGQILGVLQQPASTCLYPVDPIASSTTPMFGGDVYLNRYTEKNTFFFFYDWLYDQPDGFALDYYSKRMLPHPRYWANFNEFETSDFTSSVGELITLPSISGSGVSGGGLSFANLVLPHSYYNLDGSQLLNLSGISGGLTAATQARLDVRNAWFYMFSSGVKDFYVESEINVDFRDYGDLDTQRFYDPQRYTDLKTMFDTSIIKAGNYYKYDQSLSRSKIFMNYISWGDQHPRTYDPLIAEFCYTYTPTRIIYSLPAQYEGKRDNWFLFLANNYYDFNTRPTCVKQINKNGALIFFEADSPAQFLGVDQLQTDSGTKLTIGDGGLFSQPLQNILNADISFEYGSCQDRLSVINTPMGSYWISQNQGKIFCMRSGIDEIAGRDLKWWFANYLDYRLLVDFPDFMLKENPVIGIGCQSMYDNQNGLLYFSKKDYQLRKDLPDSIKVIYAKDNLFDVMINNVITARIELGNPMYFSDASWTISYDPKVNSWISWHDWHPDLSLPGKNTFLTIKNDNATVNKQNSIWVHNQACQLYCNYYEKDYPFEVEYMVTTGNTVNTLRSIEYYMEAYHYADNCYDRFHVLDYNFDEAVIYNTEQCSGLLKLTLSPKNNAPLILKYPIINPTNIHVLFSKEEQKYRFNQFWDITDSRGEFPINSAYPPPTPNVGSYAQRMIWNTEPNGYIRKLNTPNLNYVKDPLQRKKFRHYVNYVLLRKLVSGNKKILVMLADNKNLYSSR